MNPGTSEAAVAALDFHTALASGDYGRACGLLIPSAVEKVEAGAPGTCAEKLSQLDVPVAATVQDSAAYGRNAQVVMDQDTLFLARSGDGWRITAAGCTSRGERHMTVKWRETEMRWAFWICLGVIVVGLAYMFVIGVLAR
jgi:hypothetical protein